MKTVVVVRKKPDPVTPVPEPEPVTLLGGAPFVEPHPHDAPVAEVPAFTDEELGIVAPPGVEMTPEVRAMLYNLPGLWPFARELALKVGPGDEGTLYNLARDYRSVFPARWREMLLEDLHRRETDPIGGLSSDERMAMGLVQRVTKDNEVLRGKLEALLASAKTGEDQGLYLRGAIVGVKEVQVTIKKEQRELTALALATIDAEKSAKGE